MYWATRSRPLSWLAWSALSICRRCNQGCKAVRKRLCRLDFRLLRRLDNVPYLVPPYRCSLVERSLYSNADSGGNDCRFFNDSSRVGEGTRWLRRLWITLQKSAFRKSVRKPPGDTRHSHPYWRPHLQYSGGPRACRGLFHLPSEDQTATISSGLDDWLVSARTS